MSRRGGAQYLESQLEKAFGKAWADRYIETLLFDNPPEPM